MIEIGRLCVKITGRDAGKKCVIIDILDDKFVLIDGETRRRKCNILHIEPLSQKIEIKKNASHEDVSKVLKELGIEARITKPKPKTQRPRAKRKTPDQLRTQKEEKRKFRDLLKPKIKEETKKETMLEEKAGLTEEKKEEHHKQKEHEIEKKETKEKKEAKKSSTKKTG